jgi:cyclophilin family peptidyl-prolyl cis-trans isomerase
MLNSSDFTPFRASGFLRLHALSLLSLLFLASCSSPKPVNPAPPAPPPQPVGNLHAALETDKGTIVVEFFPNDAPKAVENFRLLAQRGYYNGLTFHRIVKGFMIQGGDPAGDGSGGVSAWGGTFADEIQPDSALYQRGYRRGIVAMANAGPNTNGSQFFIMLKDYPLPPNYVIFAQVTEGTEVVEALGETPVTMGPGGELSRPVVPPVIRRVTLLP